MSEDNPQVTVTSERLQKVIQALSFASVDEFEQCLVLLQESEAQDEFRELETAFTIFVQELAEAKRQRERALARAEAANRELEAKLETIEMQQAAIRELSTPIIEVWTGVLCVPVVGVLDSQRAAELTNTLLLSVVEKRSKHVIVDVTGIEAMDTSSADHFLRIARSVTLLGAQCLLSGMHPNVARTIVHMGVELHGLQSHRTMRDALKRCVLDSRQKAPRKKPQ